VDLIARIRSGDDVARDQLFARTLPSLERWARGRLPIYARDLVDTADVVQEAAINTLRNIEHFHPERAGAFTAYLRAAVANRITDHVRRARRRPAPLELDSAVPDAGCSPLEQAIGRQRLSRYEAALARLSDVERAAIIARLELDYSYAEVANALGKPTADAARMAVVRAIQRLIEEMGRER
jgi:RNA polymerase sigma-70 factor, ECF subfamily